jgi:hypothetical protein
MGLATAASAVVRGVLLFIEQGPRPDTSLTRTYHCEMYRLCRHEEHFDDGKCHRLHAEKLF